MITIEFEDPKVDTCDCCGNKMINLTRYGYMDGVINKEDSIWKNVEFLGRILDREEALSHPWVKDVLHITDHIVLDDNIVITYFSNSQQNHL